MTKQDIDTLEDSPASRRGQPTPLRPYLFIVLECDRPTAGGARYALTGIDEIIIGRGADREATRHPSGSHIKLRVCVPGRSISSTHARLRRTGEGWLLEDAGSTNGTLVNGSPVQRVLVRDGDVIELGHTLFLLRDALASPQGIAPDLESLHSGSAPPGFLSLIPANAPRLEALTRIAKSPLPILLLGETGTGKEVIARSIHQISGRPGPFIAVNCGAIPSNLVESHLFGHEKGAFSGAIRAELGAVRAADRGTLLLDEIGDLPVAAQPAFLRFLQDSEVSPVGSAQASRIDVRIVAATHHKLAEPSARTGFRSDLFARLSGYTYLLQPLCERREDLGVFVAAILAKNAKVAAPNIEVTMSPAVGRYLLSNDWPSNIRELEHVLVRGLILAEEGRIELAHLLDGASEELVVGVPSSVFRLPPLSKEQLQLRAELIAQLERHNGSVTNVAKALGKARTQVHRWIKRFEIDHRSFRGFTQH